MTITKEDLEELRDGLEGECQGDYCEHKNGDLGAVMFIEKEYVGWKNEGNCHVCGGPIREYAMINRKGCDSLSRLSLAFGA